MESEKKKRRLVYHELDGIKPLPAVTQPSQVDRVLPEFLHDALFAAPIDVPHEFWPFKRYINLGGRAWQKEGKSIHLIERPCYENLLTFVKWRFSTREADTQQRTVVTGSAPLELMDTKGRELYTVSVGQETFLATIREKNMVVEAIYQRIAELWSGDEYTYAEALGLIWSERQDLDRDYVLEGYRRFGGSARSALKFAKMLRYNKVGKEDIESSTITAITKLAEKKFLGAEEETKIKSLLFHRSPVDDGAKYRIHFSSPYMGQKLMDIVKHSTSEALKTVVAALSIEGNHKDAYGTLYEEEVHKMFYQNDKVTSKAELLGCHPANEKKTGGRVTAKPSVSLDFLGLLLSAFQFFEAGGIGSKQKQKEIENEIETSAVLGGLQMTVSGSRKALDKPSHTVYAAHLTESLNAIKKAVENSGVKILDDIVTIFITPVETGRKMKLMDVLTKENKTLGSSIPNVTWLAPQYCAVFEVTIIEDLLKQSEPKE